MAPSSRDSLLRALDGMLRRAGAQSVLISDLVAARFGLAPTDLKCFDLVHMAGATTPGRLAAYTGLTTGATTVVIDRLERAGFVRRRPHPDDRRSVLVEVVPSSVSRVEPLYAPLAAGMARLHDRFDDRQLAVVLDYITGASELCGAHAAWLQQQPRPRRARPKGSHARPPRKRAASPRGRRDGSTARA